MRGSCLKGCSVIICILSILIGLLLSGRLRDWGCTKWIDPGIVRVRGTFPFIYDQYGGKEEFGFDDIPKLNGKVAVVTGANVGLGYYTSLHLARNGARVILGCRSANKCNAAAEAISKNITDGSVPVKGGSAEAMVMDLASFESVRNFADKLRETLNENDVGLDVLVLNAGFIAQKYYETEDGIESQWQVNHVGHHLLYTLVEDLIVLAANRQGKATVTSLSSGASYNAERVPSSLEEINERDEYVPFRRYSETKLANVLFAMEAQKRVHQKSDRIYVNAVHPGAVNSDFLRKETVTTFLGDTLGPLLYDFAKAAMRNCIAWDSETASLTQLYTAVSPEISTKNIKGKYFHPIAKINPGTALATENAAAALWTQTEVLIQSHS